MAAFQAAPAAVDFIDGTAEGRRFRVYLQERGTSCGPASFRTIAHYLTGKAPTEDWVRVHTNRNMISPDILNRIAALGFHAKNMTAEQEHLVPLFRAFGLKASATRITDQQELLERIQTASRARAFIAGVTWDQGGGHWVVVPHVNGANIVVLDPGSGIGVETNFPHYQNAGTFDGFLIEVTT